ncbi:MAG: MinD/ParA family protein [Clostridia bacterium]|nr:MinD/ParA family protein [Clostridia bacterium]
MSDQAAELRGMAQEVGDVRTRQQRTKKSADDSVRVVAVTSGKGGVGKTNFVVNLAMALADMGMRVSILDADLGLANVDVLLGLPVRHNLHHVLNGTLSLEDIVVRGPRDIELIPGASGLREIADMDDASRANLIGALARAVRGRDILIVDTGAGMSKNVMDFVLSAQETIVMTAPEPTAMADAYAMIKVISRENPSAAVRVVVNMCASRDEAKNVVEQLALLASRFLSFTFEPLGYIPIDSCVAKAVKQRQPFVLAYPYCPASGAMLSISRKFRGMDRPDAHEPGITPFIKRFLGMTAPDYLL